MLSVKPPFEPAHAADRRGPVKSRSYLLPPAGWFLLLALGQASTLTMINAGPLVGYQHYRLPWRLAVDAPAWALTLFAIEVVAVVFGFATWRPPVGVLVRRAGRLRFAAGVALFVLTSATLSKSVIAFGSELLVASSVQLVHLGAVCLFAVSLRQDTLDRHTRFWSRLLGVPGDGTLVEPGGVDRVAWIAAAWVTIIAAILAVASYQMHPHVPDEVAYLIQARYLAAGHLSLPPPPVPEAFDVDLMMVHASRWFSAMPSVWPFLLAVGSAVGVPWLVNPLLGGLNVLLASLVLREIYPRHIVRIAILLFAASPWNLFMAMNLMSHMASLTAALLASYAVARLRRDERWRWVIAAGVALGVAGMLRQLEGLALGFVLVLWVFATQVALRRRAVQVVALGVVAAATALPMLAYNQYLTGSARLFPVTMYMDATFGPGRNDLGFGANRGLGWPGLDPFPGHGPIDVAVNADFNLFQTNVELFGWATGAALIFLLLAVAGRLTRADRWMLVAIGAIIGIHSLYFFSGGSDFGARYWFLIIVPTVALAARGIEELGNRAEGAAAGGRLRVLAGAACVSIVAIVVFVPWRAADKYYHYRKMEPGARAFLTNEAMRDGIVLIRGRRHPDYASAVVYSALQPGEAGPTFAWDRGDDVRRRLVDAYRDRKFWVVEGPTVTSDSYRIVAGPLSGAELLARRDSLIP